MIPATGLARYSTVGNVPPRGICGSGMIDLVASLFLTGWIDAAGKFDRVRPCPAIRVEGRRASYTLAPAEESATGKPLVITETDIENIIRTKASIYSACALMLNQVGLRFDDLRHIYIAGGFGRFLDLENATVIGLIPDLPREKFRYIGNSSLMGSYMVVVSQDFRQRQLELARRMTYLELNTDPAYMEQYTGALFLPHTDPSRFPSVVARLRARGRVLNPLKPQIKGPDFGGSGARNVQGRQPLPEPKRCRAPLCPHPYPEIIALNIITQASQTRRATPSSRSAIFIATTPCHDLSSPEGALEIGTRLKLTISLWRIERLPSFSLWRWPVGWSGLTTEPSRQGGR